MASNLVSASRTTTQTINVDNLEARGIRVILDTTVVPGAAPSNVVTISQYDPASGKYIVLLTGVAVATVSTVTYSIHPDITAVANLAVKDLIPRGRIQIKVTCGNANAATYSLGISWLM